MDGALREGINKGAPVLFGKYTAIEHDYNPSIRLCADQASEALTEA